MSDRSSARREISRIAAAMVAGSVDLLEGCRRVAALRKSLSDSELSDPDLLVLVGIESELDDIPHGGARELWAPAALAAKDEEGVKYLEAAREALLRACRALSARWSPRE